MAALELLFLDEADVIKWNPSPDSGVFSSVREPNKYSWSISTTVIPRYDPVLGSMRGMLAKL